MIFYNRNSFFCSNEMRIKIFHAENLFLVSIFKGFSSSGFFKGVGKTHKPTQTHTDPHRPSKRYSIIVCFIFFSNVSNTDPTDLQKEYLFSIWSHTDHTDLLELAY